MISGKTVEIGHLKGIVKISEGDTEVGHLVGVVKSSGHIQANVYFTGGYGNGIIIRDTLDEHGGTIREIITGDAIEPYGGEYTVKPTVDDQVLDTKYKVLVDDLTVLAIPYYETTNIADGLTVYIGE